MGIQMVVFRAGKGIFAIHIDKIERIIGYEKITSLPDTSDYILGLISYQDRIMPIVDLNQRLFRQPLEYKDDCKILVLSIHGYPIGLLVDSVEEIKSVVENVIEKPANIMVGISPQYINGLIKDDEDIIIDLDVDQIFKPEEKDELFNVVSNS